MGIDFSGFDFGSLGSAEPMGVSSFDYSIPSLSFSPSDMFSGYTPNFFDTGSWMSQYSPDFSGSDYNFNYTPQFGAGVPTMQGTSFDIPMPTMDYAFAPAQSEPSKSWVDDIMSKWNSMPLDKQVGLGMGLMGGIGSAMGALNSNKMAKAMLKRNQKLADAEAEAMDRRRKIQAATDPYNYSVDVTTPASVAYTPLTADQAAHYGESGAPYQQLSITPGTTTRSMISGMANGGPVLNGHTSGQSDMIPSLLSDGEYVMDADVVAALGDGNTRAGASVLNQMRENIRKHKRSASNDRIPPKAKPIFDYLPKRGRK